MTSDQEARLPELPEPYDTLFDDTECEVVFTSAQMRSYGSQSAREARLAAIEECAKACEAFWAGSDLLSESPCAAAIRSLKGK